MSATGKNLKSMGIDFVRDAYAPLGHNDPAWSPDGKSIAFTYDAKGGGKGGGAPQIGVIRRALQEEHARPAPKEGLCQPVVVAGRPLSSPRSG